MNRRYPNSLYLIDQRELEKRKLHEQIREKENQIKYCQEQTKMQAEAIGIITASNSFRSHRLGQLNEHIIRFNEEMVRVTKLDIQ